MTRKRRRGGPPPQLPRLARPVYRYDRLITDSEFRQRVRRHTPTSLLPLAAAAAARWHNEWPESPYRKYTPWALAEIARTSLLFGAEHGRSAATEQDLFDCLNAYSALRDPELHQRQPGGAARFFLRVSSEQFPHQQPVFNELARTVALFEQTSATKPLRVLAEPDWPDRLLGCSLRDYVATGLLLHVAARPNEGRFNLDWLEQPNLAEIVAEVPGGVLRDVVRRHFVTDTSGFRGLQTASAGIRDSAARRFGFNPLSAKPVITGVDPECLLMPAPRLLISKVSPLGVYYLGAAEWESAFTGDLGHLFEEYVGRQLRLMPGVEDVRPAVVYDGSNAETVDWIAIFSDLVLLVEVKSTRPTETVRVGTPEAVDAIQTSLSRSIEQLNTTAGLIRGRHPALLDVPRDRRIGGLTVTMEPFFVINAGLFQDWLPARDVPGSVCSAFELEMLASVSDPAQALIEAWDDPERQTWPIRSILGRREIGRNHVLDEAFATYPWKEAVPDDNLPVEAE